MRKTRHNYTPLIEYKLFPDKLDSGPREKGMHTKGKGQYRKTIDGGIYQVYIGISVSIYSAISGCYNNN